MTIKSDFEKSFNEFDEEKHDILDKSDYARWGFIQGMKKILEMSDRYQNIYPAQYDSFVEEVFSTIKEFES